MQNDNRITTYTDLPVVPVRETEHKAKALLESLEGFAIVTEADAGMAGELLREVHRELKDLDKLRLEAGKPAREAQKDINAFFQPALKALGTAKGKLKKIIDDHRVTVAEQNAKALEILSQGQAAPMVPVVDVPGTRTRQDVEVKVIDVDKIPREYMCVDWSALKILAKSGGEAPPGVEFVRVERTVMGR